jgi:tetratricopeptide (TPR) repeat protein
LAAVLLAVVAAVSVIEVTAPAFTVLGRLTSAFSGSDPSVISRFVTWGVAVQAALAAPLLGTGPDTFLTAWYRYRPLSDLASSGYERLNDDAHNFVLQLAATVGIPGTIAIVAFVALVLGSGWRVISSARDSRHAMLTVAWMAAAVAGLVYALTGPMNIGASAVLAVSLGAVAAPVVREVDLKSASRVWLSMAAVLVLAAALVPIARWVVADISLASAVYSASSGEQALALAERSAGLAPWSYQYAAAAADLKISRAQQALAAVGSGQVAPGSSEYEMAQEAVEDAGRALEKLTDDFPLEYEGFVKRAQYLNVLVPNVGPSAAEEALEVARLAAAVYPRGLTAHNEQIAALFALGRYDEAVKLADTVVSWDPNQPRTAILRMLSYAAAGRTDEAREQSADLASRWPGDPAVQQALEDLEAAIVSSDPVE